MRTPHVACSFFKVLVLPLKPHCIRKLRKLPGSCALEALLPRISGIVGLVFSGLQDSNV